MDEQKNGALFSASFLPTPGDYIEARLLRAQLRYSGTMSRMTKLAGAVLLVGGVAVLLFLAKTSTVAFLLADFLILLGMALFFLTDAVLPMLERRRAKKSYESSNVLKESIPLSWVWMKTASGTFPSAFWKKRRWKCCAGSLLRHGETVIRGFICPRRKRRRRTNKANPQQGYKQCEMRFLRNGTGREENHTSGYREGNEKILSRLFHVGHCGARPA